MKRKFWKPEDDKYLIDHYEDEDTKEIVKVLDRSIHSIYARVSMLNLHKSEKAKKLYGCYLTGTDGRSYRYKKGHIPFNKGKTMSAEQYEVSKATMFKKGHKPSDTLPVGSIRLRTNYKRKSKYLWIKIGEPHKWEMLHRYNWKKKYGFIPDKMNLVFITDDIFNCEISNLELVSDEDLMRRNTIHNRYPDNLKEVIDLLGRIKRKIKNYE